MAGKPKKRIDYAGWSVDIFDSDSKIDKLLDAFGWKGFGVYFYLCTRAYGSDGYYYLWGFDDCASTARKMGGGVTSQLIREVVQACFRIGLFDGGLYEKYGILTSKGIQRSYYVVARERNCKNVIKEYWLLDKDESKGLFLIPLKSDVSPENGDSSPENGDSPHSSVVKDSKGKEREGIPSTHTLYGKFKNVELSSDQYEEIASRYMDEKKLIEKLSAYKESTGHKYKSDFATLLRWAEDDGWPKRKAMPDSEKEEETKRIPMPEEVRERISGLFRPQ